MSAGVTSRKRLPMKSLVGLSPGIGPTATPNWRHLNLANLEAHSLMPDRPSLGRKIGAPNGDDDMTQTPRRIV